MVEYSERERAKGYFKDPEKYVRNNPYIELRAQLVRQMLPPFQRKSVLDMGCGDGRISIPLIGESDELLLLDSSKGMLELALGGVPADLTSRVQSACVDLTAFEPSRTFDVVLCLGVLAHVPDLRATVKLIARCVAPQGCALIQITDDSKMLGRLAHWLGRVQKMTVAPARHTLNHMTLDIVQDEMKRQGLNLATCRRYTFVPGLRRLPQGLSKAIAGATSRQPLAQLGGEVLAMFTGELR